MAASRVMSIKTTTTMGVSHGNREAAYYLLPLPSHFPSRTFLFIFGIWAIAWSLFLERNLQLTPSDHVPDRAFSISLPSHGSTTY